MADKPTILEYELKETFNAPRINLKPGEKITYKPYLKGAKVRGFLLENEDPKAELPPSVKTIITEDMLYAIPMRVIVQPDSDPANSSATPGALKDKLNAIKASDLVGNVVRSSQNTANGFLTGAIVGGIAGLVLKRSVLGTAVLGGIAGALTSYYVSKKKININIGGILSADENKKS